MTKKKFSIILIIMTLIGTMLFASCGSSPKTLEEMFSSDKELAEEIESFATDSGLTVNIKDNDVIYTMDCKDLGLEKSDEVVALFKELLIGDDYVDLFSGVCEELEEETKIQGVRVIVTYTVGEEELITQTYNSLGIVE